MGCVPDLTAFDIKIIPGLDKMAAGEFLHHCVIVLGVVAGNMTDLCRDVWNESKQMAIRRRQ